MEKQLAEGRREEQKRNSRKEELSLLVSTSQRLEDFLSSGKLLSEK